jgi:2-amino-4-hydroxy-6-hydroxymethyldihydropteridine diphosphokinase
MAIAVLSLGSNLGDRRANLELMWQKLHEVLEPPLTRSRLMETAPVGVQEDQPWYYNCIVSGWYDASPQQLLAACQTIENDLGRERPFPKAPRTADIDILLFGTMIVQTPELIIPHPLLARRRFCLEGLREIGPDLWVPQFDMTVMQVYEQMDIETGRQQLRTVPDRI